MASSNYFAVARLKKNVDNKAEWIYYIDLLDRASSF